MKKILALLLLLIFCTSCMFSCKPDAEGDGESDTSDDGTTDDGVTEGGDESTDGNGGNGSSDIEGELSDNVDYVGGWTDN